ncbi:MAG: hypothetical protein ACUVWX_09415 [Kiritimatiellia bacterium]
MGNGKVQRFLITLNRTLILALPFIVIALCIAALFIVFRATAGQTNVPAQVVAE